MGSLLEETTLEPDQRTLLQHMMDAADQSRQQVEEIQKIWNELNPHESFSSRTPEKEHGEAPILRHRSDQRYWNT